MTNTLARRLLVENGQTLLGIAALIGLWELACWFFSVPSWLLPAPSRVAVETWGAANPVTPSKLAGVSGSILMFAVPRQPPLMSKSSLEPAINRAW